MNSDILLHKLTEKIEQLHNLAREIYNDSEKFPAVNRNAKRILACAEMLRINVENP